MQIDLKKEVLIFHRKANLDIIKSTSTIRKNFICTTNHKPECESYPPKFSYQEKYYTLTSLMAIYTPNNQSLTSNMKIPLCLYDFVLIPKT